MSVLVQKYGGTSVDGPERLRAVAGRVAAARAAGHDLVVVVSAMGQTTDELLRLAREVATAPSRRELDMLLTAGERMAMALLAMALGERGVPAISFTGSQSGILTDGGHGAARIAAVRGERIRAGLAAGQVVIVAGFQGVHPETREITTLGRGGSDTTAVALAAAFAPSACEIYTDVPGVLTADPREVPGARVIPRLDYALCSTLAHLGGRVLHARSVDLAARARVAVRVRSSFDDSPGTLITEDPMEQPVVVAIAHRPCSIAIAQGVPGGRGETRAILEAVATAHPELDLVAEERDPGGVAALVWIGEREEIEALAQGFRALRGPGGEWKLAVEHGAAFVSLAGLGLGAREAAAAEAALERAGIEPRALRVTPTALVFRVDDARAGDAVRALHAAFLEGVRRAAGPGETPAAAAAPGPKR
jgi:aspartate kinase